MRAILQRVREARVVIDGKTFSEIQTGFLVFLGIEADDDPSDAEWIADKTRQMRVFQDPEDKMNLSLQDIDGRILVVSQFTLHASTRKGNRPSFIRAARPDQAIPLYEHFIDYLSKQTGQRIKTGVFGADMKIELINDGPVTIILDSKNKE